MRSELEKMQSIKRFLSTNAQIRSLINYLGKAMAKYDPEKQQEFMDSPEVKKLTQKITKIRLQQLEDIMDTLLEPETIIALPITIEKNFTLFFVIIPSGRKFDWHDHPDMIGKTKCLYGNLTITSIDRSLLKEDGQNLTYDIKDMKIEKLSPENPQESISTIAPSAFNIHKIEAEGLSAFFDLLMPDYPNDECLFLETVKQEKEKLVLRKLKDSREQIKSFDQVLRELTEKNKVKNIILQ